MPLWPISLGLDSGGPASFFFLGLGGGGSTHTLSLSPNRTLVPAFVSGYAGRDFPALSTASDDVFAIDLGDALDAADSLNPFSLATLFFTIDAPVANYSAALDGPPKLFGTVAAQAIGQPPAARYLIGFTCGTAQGRIVQIHSFFNAVGIPNAA
jgi:hypothetical protein